MSELLYPREEWQWYGTNGHLIVGQDCRYHLATLVGPWWVSTVGQWLPDESSREIHADVRGIALEGRGDERRADFMRKFGWVEIGHGRTFETMVFRAGEICADRECACEGSPLIADWSELDSNGYNEARAAREGHLAMCEKWAQIDPGDQERVESAWRG
jgi:hypothetical protein